MLKKNTPLNGYLGVLSCVVEGRPSAQVAPVIVRSSSPLVPHTDGESGSAVNDDGRDHFSRCSRSSETLPARLSVFDRPLNPPLTPAGGVRSEPGPAVIAAAAWTSDDGSDGDGISVALNASDPFPGAEAPTLMSSTLAGNLSRRPSCPSQAAPPHADSSAGPHLPRLSNKEHGKMSA